MFLGVLRVLPIATFILAGATTLIVVTAVWLRWAVFPILTFIGWPS
jgi:hypothetical protein